MKHLIKAAAAFAALAMLFSLASCDDDDDDDDDDSSASSYEIAYISGTYWGSLTANNQSYDMALTVSQDSIGMYSEMMNSVATTVAFTKSGENITFTASGGTLSSSLTGTFSLSADTVTCVATISAMGTSSDTLTKGDPYDFSYGVTYTDSNKTTLFEDAFYGTYWGTWTIMDSDYPAALVLDSSGYTLYYDMGSSSSHSTAANYPYVTYTVNSEDYTDDDGETITVVEVYAYESDPSSDSSATANCYAIFSSIDEAEVGVTAMSSFCDDFTVTRGADYDGSYGTLSD